MSRLLPVRPSPARSRWSIWCPAPSGAHPAVLGTRRAAQPSTDYRHWKRLLREAGIRDGRLYDARHTASTVLLPLGVPERIVMAITGWSSTVMAQRCQHVTEPMLNDVGKKIGAALWGSALGVVDEADDRGESAAQLRQ